MTEERDSWSWHSLKWTSLGEEQIGGINVERRIRIVILEMFEMPTGHIPNWKSEEKPRVMIKSLEIQPIDGI